MRVELLYYTPIEVALKASLVCTNSDSKIANYDATEFLKKLVSQGHTSVIEHINYSFFIDGISRALLQELARHRHISLSVQSTRWALHKTTQVDHMFSEDEELIMKDNDKSKILIDLKNTSNTLKEQIENASKHGIPNDILKYYIQESTTTKLVLTLNARELRHIFELRTSPRALKEFRTLCLRILSIIPQSHKFLFEEFFT